MKNLLLILALGAVACAARQGGHPGSEASGVDGSSSSVSSSSPNEESNLACYATVVEGRVANSGVLVCNVTADGLVWPDFFVTELAATCNGGGRGMRLVGSCDDDDDCPESATCVVADHTCETAPACDSAADCNDGEACFCANATFVQTTSGQNPANTCLPAQCKSETDCGSFACAVSVDGCRRYAGAFCHTAEDDCQFNDDCPDHTYRCAFASGENRWTCQQFAICQ